MACRWLGELKGNRVETIHLGFADEPDWRTFVLQDVSSDAQPFDPSQHFRPLTILGIQLIETFVGAVETVIDSEELQPALRSPIQIRTWIWNHDLIASRKQGRIELLFPAGIRPGLCQIVLQLTISHAEKNQRKQKPLSSRKLGDNMVELAH